jgi:hypothetical protein
MYGSFQQLDLLTYTSPLFFPNGVCVEVAAGGPLKRGEIDLA